MSLTEDPSKEANILQDTDVTSHENLDNNAIIDTSSSDCEASEPHSRSSSPQIPPKPELPTFAQKMLNLIKEIIIIVVVMVTYAALTTEPPKVSKAPTAYPFFPVNSIVKDWYKGQISKAIEDARASDIAFVMFYAPWDAESQYARKEFEKAAEYMKDYVTFAAVNCWQPNSECRNQYSKVFRWPVLIAYPTHGRGVQYTGPIKSIFLIKFLQNICKPLNRLTETEPIEYEDAYIEAILNAKPYSLNYSKMYTTALRYLEKDPLQSVKFFVRSYGGDEFEIKLHLWNQTIIYPSHNREARPEAILNWITSHLQLATSWISPTGSKSLLLSGNLQPGPSLILFTPRNPFFTSTDYYYMLQSIGESYHKCKDTVLNSQLHPRRFFNVLKCKEMLKTCEQNLVITGNVPCESFVNSNLSNYCSNLCKVNQSVPNGNEDFQRPEALKKRYREYGCKNLMLGNSYTPFYCSHSVFTKVYQTDVQGLGCNTNKTLKLLAMDSLTQYHFAERLGVDLLKFPDKSAAVIVNEKMESHYIMEAVVNNENLRKFIYNFTKGLLERSVKSISELESKPLQYNRGSCSRTDVCLEELNSNTFLPAILERNKAVVVFYYSKQCSFCSGISFIFLTVAKRLSSVDNLKFVRINGEENILPWEYSMESYPTIILFPAIQKSESRVYPNSLPVTVPNLINFILTNVDASLSLHALWILCKDIKFQEERESCMRSLRLETLGYIESTLRSWRMVNKRRKQTFLYRLKLIRQLHLLFAHSSEKLDLIESWFKKLHNSADIRQEYRD